MAAMHYQSIHDLTPPTQPANIDVSRSDHNIRGLRPLLFSISDVGSLTLGDPLASISNKLPSQTLNYQHTDSPCILIRPYICSS